MLSLLPKALAGKVKSGDNKNAGREVKNSWKTLRAIL
jgi:hypothetical protein